MSAHPISQVASTPIAQSTSAITPTAQSSDLEIEGTSVHYLRDMDLLVFEQTVKGTAGRTVPQLKEGTDGASVLAYVFPTTLKAEDVGFSSTEGIVALAATSHPDFDDTPLWDENNNLNPADDGVMYHSHWVVLNEDDRVPGGLSVKQFSPTDSNIVMPPTHPDMPMYFDSPGFPVMLNGNTLKVLVPASRIGSKTDFKFDGVAAYLQVNATNNALPMLGVYQVYSVDSGDLSLPYSVQPQ
ncbi:hypothetical protein IFO70_29245 [Phormidium tenue FACHB-886]|nr:hypothetical protein [Phormidium tenue FACHB-886]